MARVSKPIRGCLYPLIALVFSLLICQLLSYAIGVWSYLLWLPIYFYFHFFSPLDTFDLWLRQYTKDPHWLMTQEGREWLDTDEGKKWFESQSKKVQTQIMAHISVNPALEAITQDFIAQIEEEKKTEDEALK